MLHKSCQLLCFVCVCVLFLLLGFLKNHICLHMYGVCVE
jgi:hypothetical protein